MYIHKLFSYNLQKTVMERRNALIWVIPRGSMRVNIVNMGAYAPSYLKCQKSVKNLSQKFEPKFP